MPRLVSWEKKSLWVEVTMGTEGTSPMRKSRFTGQMSTSGVSSLWLPIQVRKRSQTLKGGWMNAWFRRHHFCLPRVWPLLRIPEQHAVFGGRTDDSCRLLQCGEGWMEAHIGAEGEENGVRCCSDKRVCLCERGIFLLKRDLSAEHWEVWPSAGLLGDRGDFAQPDQITRMCLRFQCLVPKPYKTLFFFVPNRSIVVTMWDTQWHMTRVYILHRIVTNFSKRLLLEMGSFISYSGAL